MTLSIEFQKFAMRYIKNDITLRLPELTRDELMYFCSPHEKYYSIKYWSENKDLLTNKNIEMGFLDLFFSKFIWKPSTHIGCSVYGGTNGIFTYCRITPRGNVPEGYDENVFYQAD
uniref:SCP domain-containing protein n=1 Tax=Strongyloides papillosus TaxID=174720 RepID=A0A0N5CAZ5_STREA